MRNQYFGDVNDYCKYGILREMARQGLQIQVGWMLTEDDDGGHGIHTRYLNRPAEWRHFDPELYDFLTEAVARDERRVGLLDEGGLIPGAVFTDTPIPADPAERRTWFRILEGYALGKPMIFLDPDTGIAWPPNTHRKSDLRAYVRLDEVERLHANGYSLLIYQHLPRYTKANDQGRYLDEKSKVLLGCTKAPFVVSFAASRTTFLLIPQAHHAVNLETIVKAIDQHWKGKLTVSQHVSK